MRERYEKPRVTTIEIGELLDEASRLLHSACVQLEASKVAGDRIRPVILDIEAGISQAMLDLDKAKNIKSKIDGILELSSRREEPL